MITVRVIRRLTAARPFPARPPRALSAPREMAGGRGVTRTRSGQREEQWTERCGGGTAEPAETFAVAPAVRVVRSPAFSGGIGRSIVLLVDYRHAGNPCGRMLWH